MSSIHLGVRGWVVWTPAGWLRGEDENFGKHALASSAPPLLRRRVTRIGRMALEGAWEVSDLAQARFVFASRHGEFERTLSLLEAVAEKHEISPADFTLSVHNALAGLLSIARHNRSGHTSLASGRQSFACGLLEAGCCLEEFPSRPVVYVYYDEPLPGPYADFNDAAERPVAIAIAIERTRPGHEIVISCESVAETTQNTGDFMGETLRFLAGSVVETTVVGQGLGWHFRRSGAASIS